MAGKQKDTKVVNSVLCGLTNVKVYHPQAPPFALRYLVDLGNIVNTDSEDVTFLQIYRGAAQVIAGF